MGNQTSISIEQYNKHRSLMNCGKELVADAKNARIIDEKLLLAYNMRDRRTLQSIIGKDATFSFKGAEAAMPLDMFVEQVEMIQDSFPDVFVSYDEVKEIQPGVVKVSNFYSRGTHTGKGFSYGPFPEIPTSGKTVFEGPCQFIIFMKNGKLTHWEIEMPEDDITGPPGYYTKIGGKMELSA